MVRGVSRCVIIVLSFKIQTQNLATSLTGVVGGQNPPFWIFFSICYFLEKKIPKLLLNIPVPTKKFKPPRKISGYASA